MTEKIAKMLSLILAVMLLLSVFAPSFAEESVDDETEVFEAFEEDTEEPGDSDQGLSDFDDDYCGFVEREVIAEHTPEMTHEFIFADEPDDTPESEIETAETAAVESESEEENVQMNEAAPEESEKAEANASDPVTFQEIAETQDASEPEAETPEADDPFIEETDDTLIEETEEGAVEEVTEIEAPEEEYTEGEPVEEIEYEDASEEKSGHDNISVTVEATMVSENEMKLCAVVNGPEGYVFAFQWQISEDGEHYRDIDEATNDELQVELSDSNIHSLWRVKVNAI